MLASRLLMVRPSRFFLNPETVSTNAFQNQSISESFDVSARALSEYEKFRDLLLKHEIEIVEFQDDRPGVTPDSIFPNNWVSFHEDRRMVLYPMMAENRRLERRSDWIEQIQKQIAVKDTLDLSNFEKSSQFLEGTGSLVLDRDHRIAYAALSPRTCEEPLNEFCNRLNFTPVRFHSLDKLGKSIYHTNVMMSVGEAEAVVCFESISNESERRHLRDQLERTDKRIVELSFDQISQFAGNLLQVCNSKNERFWIGSKSAIDSLSTDQKSILSKNSRILFSDLETIERLGGGSARCMLCEIF